MLLLPFFSELASSRRVLIAGAGGGFDFLCGLPLFLALRAEKKEVFFANLSFSRLSPTDDEWVTDVLARVGPDSRAETSYFPEKYLAQWFAARGEQVPVYTLLKTGVVPARESYTELARQLDLDTIVLVDGGTDSLLRGDESDLGTPTEDMVSIAAVDGVPVARKLLVSVGFGIDAFHGVCHAHVLEAVAELDRAGGYLGAFSLLRSMPEVPLFGEALAFIHARMPRQPSIVCSSLQAAFEGHFGDHHATERTRGSELFINPLMALCWCFRLDAVARRVLYLDQIRETQTIGEVGQLINTSRRLVKRLRGPRPLPM